MSVAKNNDGFSVNYYMKIAALVDFFIHPIYWTKPEELRRARLFVRACLLTSLFSNSYIWLSMLFQFERGIYLMIFNVVGFLALPFLAKTKLPLNWLGNLYVSIGAFAVVVLTYFSGGMWSAIYPWLAFVPVLALLVVNKFSGGVWGGISLIIMLWFGKIAYDGVDLPIEYNIEMKTIWYISVLPGLLLIILFIGFVFESIQTNALKDLEGKNSILKDQKETIAMQSSKLEKLIEDKDYIIRILAHDLNNPLANISSLVTLIEDESNSAKKSKYVGMINKSSSHAQDLIRRVLEMDILDQKNLELQLETLDVSSAVPEVIDLMRESAKKKKIQINLNDQSLQNTIRADKTYFSLIFENLISNAIKFSPEGKQIQITISNGQSDIQIKIEDEGPGIDPREESQLFKKFSKLSSKPTAGESSTGLGLSLVKRYTELINGEVWYESKSELGATFVVEFPLTN